MSASRLQLGGIGRAFNGVPVLEHIDLDVAPGAMLGLIGPNGAGKTTLFNILSGFVSADSGSLRLDGQDIGRMSPRARSRAGVVRTFQKSLVFPSLTVRDNVAMALRAAAGTGYRWWGGPSARLAADTQARALLGQSGLAARIDALAADLSYGEQRLLDIVIALAQTPRVLLLDEPTAGLSQAEAQQVLGLVSAHRADAAVVLISHDIDIVFGVCERVSTVQLVFAVKPSKDEHLALDAVAATGRAQGLPADHVGPAASDVAFLQISGGSTGLSKLIPRTHDDYIYTLRESDRICGLDADSVFLAALPIAHNFPMSSPGVLGAVYAGATVVLSPSPSPEAAFPLIERERVKMTSLVPPLLLVWLQAAATTAHDISSLKVMQVGGAKLTAEVARRVKPVLGVTLQQVFGMAEGLVNYTRLDDPEDIIIHTQGRPISEDDEVLVVDDQGQPVPEGEPGYLLTRGPYTIRGYHNNPSANARSFTADGFYRTGDIVKRDAQGYLTVQGRATDHINRAGEKISAEEIEDHLLAHPNVFDAAVVSIPDEYLGERSCAFIIAQGDKPRGAQIKQWMRERGVAEFKVPDQVVFVERFASTAALKISRRELRAALRDQLMTPPQGDSV